ncbi:hypothetical protein COV27_01220 [candidate division WWE3 bacterium CG10_big_fil_rev_8_21_14_0_10_39_14]|nr:MAG: hypothetical protein COV27_01220 [candidate division WWE3 bacterium CG10_big_fil_rev_8_21_14_0_10_39_14]
MEFDLKSKPILISFVFGAIILVVGIAFAAIKMSSKPSVINEEQAGTPAVKTEEGNPRVIVTEPEKYSKQMEEAAKNAAPTTPVVVTISDANFVPAEVTVKAPFIVTFTNKGEVAHSVKGTSGKWGSLKELEPGESYSQQFDVAGTYEYYDPLNTEMKGKVVVE